MSGDVWIVAFEKGLVSIEILQYTSDMQQSLRKGGVFVNRRGCHPLLAPAGSHCLLAAQLTHLHLQCHPVYSGLINVIDFSYNCENAQTVIAKTCQHLCQGR